MTNSIAEFAAWQASRSSSSRLGLGTINHTPPDTFWSASADTRTPWRLFSKTQIIGFHWNSAGQTNAMIGFEFNIVPLLGMVLFERILSGLRDGIHRHYLASGRMAVRPFQKPNR